MNTSEKILSFSPYAFWRLHALYEVAICHNLQWRGHSYDYVSCDGLFTDCDLFWEAMTGPRPAHACAACQTQVKSMLEDCRIPNKWLGKYRTPDCEQVAQAVAQKLKDSELLSATFNGYPVGDWVKSSVHTHLRINAIDLSNPKHCATLRSYVYSGVVALTCVGRMLDAEQPTIMLLFNGRMAITRIALELAKERGIRVVCHERGMAKETLLMWENEGCLSLGPYPKLWNEWGEIPLSEREVSKVTRWLTDRAHGTNLNWTAFSVLSSLGFLADFLARHRTKKIWSLFTSSMDEMVSDDDYSSVFGTQNRWIEETIRFVRDRPDVALVIRVHPNSGGKKSMGRNQGEVRFFENLRTTLPDNIAVVMPDDQVSTYALIERTSLGFAYGSTVALEMACRGIRVLLAARSPWMSCSAITLLNDAGSYASLLDEYAKKTRSTAEAEQIARAAYRFAYAYIFRWNIPFPLVSMPNIYSGVLTAKTLEELKPGVHDCLDYCTEIVLGIRRSIPGATRAVRAGAAEEELSALRHDQKRLAGEPMEVEAPGVAVVITGVSSAESLRACMRSVANQTFRRFEVVVVYDGQIETVRAAAEVCREEFRGLPLALLDERNAGDAARARNAGIAHAKAPFVLPLNAEDKIDPEYLDDAFRVLDADPAVDVVYSDSLYISTMGRSRRKPGEFNSGALAGMNQLVYCSVYRRTIWEKVGGYRENVAGLEDWDFWIAASLAGASARYIPRVGLVTQPKPNEMGSRPVDEQKLGIAQVMLNNPVAYSEEQLTQSRQLLFQHTIQRAEELMRSGNMSDATALMKRAGVLATTPEGVTRVGEILTLLRDVAEEAGDHSMRAKAAEVRQALAANPDDIELLRALVALSLDAASWREAAHACIKILRQAPNEWDVLRALAHCVRESGDPETATLLRDHVRTMRDVRFTANAAKLDSRAGNTAADTLEHGAVCTMEPIFGDSEINEITRLLAMYASGKADANVTGELFALQDGLVKFIATAETESLAAHLEGSVGQVFALLIEGGLPAQVRSHSN